MSKNIIVVTGSPRANGNSEILAGAFIEGARQGGHSCACKPVYWYGLSSHIKAMIDRMFAGCVKRYPITSIALLITYSDTGNKVAAPVISHFEAISYYMGWENAGIIAQEGVKEAGEIRGKKSLTDARDLGASFN